MNFQNFIEKGAVRRGQSDIQLAKSLVSMSSNHTDTMDLLELTDIAASTIMSGYYEALREIVEAMCAKEGYKVYSHEALAYFLKERGENLAAEKFDRFRKIRNNIHYYGKQIDKESVRENKKDIKGLIVHLKEKFLNDIV